MTRSEKVIRDQKILKRLLILPIFFFGIALLISYSDCSSKKNTIPSADNDYKQMQLYKISKQKPVEQHK